MLDVLNTSTGRSFNTETVFKDEVVAGRYASNFALALLAKDVSIAASLAEASGLETPVCELVSARWAAARDALPAGRRPLRGPQGLVGRGAGERDRGPAERI